MAVLLAIPCLISTICGQPSSRWVLRDSGTTANLWGVAQGAAIDALSPIPVLVAVGEQGAIVRSRDGGMTWARQQSGTEAWLTAVGYFQFGGSARRFIAVGEGGTIVSSPDGTTWTREASPTHVRLNAIGPGQVTGTVYAFGEAGAGWLIRDLNGEWSRHEAPFTDRWMRGFTFNAVAGERGAFFVHAVDSQDLGLTTWRAVSVPVASDLEALALAPSNATGAPANTLVAVGANGTIIQRTVAGDWVTRNSGTMQRLRGLTVKTGGTVTILTNTLRLSLSEFFAVGASGTMLRSADGVVWQPDVVPTQRNLNGTVAMPDAVIAVGDGGTIITLDRSVGVPVIVRQPTVCYDDQGRPYLEAEAAGDGAFTYLWVQLTAGAPRFVAAEGPRLLLPTSPPLNVPSPAFQLIVGNAFGITRSEPIVPHRLANLSLMGFAGSADATLIGGFSVSTLASSSTGNFLIRAVGPGLSKFGVSNPLNAPKVSVYVGDRLIAANTAWHTASNASEIRAAAIRTGAFPLSEDSLDSAVLLQLGAGNYTVVVNDASGGSGSALLEIYDIDTLPVTRLGNLSVRSLVRPGEHLTIGGLVVTGGLRKSVLIRAAGPALRAFQLSDVLTQPRFLVRSGAEIIATGAAWSDAPNAAAIRQSAVAAHAFPFADGSVDAASLVELATGAYTIEVSDAGGGRGVALLEIYEQP
jgi:photosystem II stability/assembly factor-like uncharacterized protein